MWHKNKSKNIKFSVYANLLLYKENKKKMSKTQTLLSFLIAQSI